ncbi:Cdc6/Cdc18 family protein [Halovivax limisalsi]|uniref:Cdc6/Cdc18 family protein n=1 Tax=Halovivax limisalsi TaxID=1453760 RepID=UPI001FFCEF41|nr:ORC1-type DNA replication protein [Halovivax limisalsi]
MSDDDSHDRRPTDRPASESTPGFRAELDSSEIGGSESKQGLFDDLLSGEPIFENKEVLRPSYTPHELPHRSDQINKMATILVAALRGETPSNILIYGKTGTGKTASAKFVSKELEQTSTKYSVPCDVEYINCEVTDTQYRVLAQLANTFIETNRARIDERVAELESLKEAVREYESGAPGTRSGEPARDATSNVEATNGDDAPATDSATQTSTNTAEHRQSTWSSDGDPGTGGGVPDETKGSASGDRPSDQVESQIDSSSSSTPDTTASAGEIEGFQSPDEPANDHPFTDTEFTTVEGVDDRIEQLEADRDSFEDVPMTGWPTDRVYSVFFDAVDYSERVVVIMLDEIDKLVEKSGDDTLYNLSRMNSELENSRVSIMGISNDLKFTDFLDPRVKSSLGEEEIVFPPYDANQLRDILQHRSEVAFKEGALTSDVIPLCAAFAAQEHGDARRALDLLRTAGELAERSQTDTVVEEHVRQAQDKIELDRVVEVVRTLPTQSKLVLFSIILLEQHGVHSINTGEVYNIYKRLCKELDTDVLTQRRVTDLISELDMLGIVNAVVVSKGRYGRTKEISLSVPLEETEVVLRSDSRLSDIDDVKPFVQARFDN